MEELNRTERFKKVARNIGKFVLKDKEIDPYGFTRQVSFRLPNSESNTNHLFNYSNNQDFIEDLQSLYLAMPINKVNESVNRILDNLGIDKNSSFTLEMH